MLNEQTNTSQRDYFLLASLLCATFSITTTCTGIFAIVFGCLGILFALFSKRRYGRLKGEAFLAILFSIMGLGTGLFLTAISVKEAIRILSSEDLSNELFQYLY